MILKNVMPENEIPEETYANLNNNLDDSIIFFNHGYWPYYTEFESTILRNQYSMYKYMLKDLPTNGLKILDIGCGRGGFSKIYETMGFSEIHGCDLTIENIKFAKRVFNSAEFKVCDATNLLNCYKENYFDIVTNVESSHCYRDKDAFFAGVKKILKPSGVFIYADINPTFDNFGDIVLDDITANVKKSTRENLKLFEYIEDEKTRNTFIKITRDANNFYETEDVKFLKFTCTNFK